MNFPSGVSGNGEKALYNQAMREKNEKSCSKCRADVKPIFTWNPMRPYYFVCAENCGGGE